MQRISMRSSNLQNLFTKEYENFFLDNSIIMSAPQVIHWWCILDKKNIDPQVKQKTSSKMFIWINTKNDSTETILNTITYFSSSKKEFITTPIETIFADIDSNYFKESIKSKLSEFGYTKGIEINILSENERWSGVEFCWVIQVILAAVIHILTEKISIEEINDTKAFQHSQAFKDIHLLASHLFTKSEIDNHGVIAYTAMTDDWSPIVWQDNAHKKTNEKITNIQENFNIKEKHNQPMIDYGVISFWSSYDEHYTSNLCKIKWPIKEIGACLNEKLVKARWAILKSEYDDQIIDDFINNIQQQGLFWACMENHHTLFTDIVFLFNQSKQFQDERIGIMPLTSSQYWGSFLFVTKYKKSRETIEKLFEKLQEIWHQTAYYQYISRIDGFSSEWLQIEQYIDKNLYSHHIKENDALLQHHSWQRTVGNHRKILEKIENGIIFDCVDGKIYIDNKPTNHNEILTQSWTVETIKVLFENIWWYVNNSKLPISSYSKNKNEMVGKIIWPLQELVQKKFNEKLDLQCTGNIVDFDLKLTPSKINIYLLKKIMH